MTVDISCEYRLCINGKKVAISRTEMMALRDKLNDILGGAPVDDNPTLTDRSQNTNWSEDDDTRLREMVARGKPFGVIAEALGRTDGACRLRWHKIKAA